MRHQPRLLIAVLALGTIGGFGAGFASLHHHRGCCAGWHDDRGPHASTEAEPAPAPPAR